MEQDVTELKPPLPPCPPWCTGTHGAEPPWHGIPWHESRPVVLDVRTGRVTVRFVTGIVQYPADPDPDRRHVLAWSHMTARVQMARPSDVVAFADMLTDYAGRLREVADELVIAQQQEQARVEADLKNASREG